jgi:DNA-binding response OmpR family regulator
VELELLHEGYTVEKAFDGRSGLDSAIKSQYDLILLDIMLPGLNGLEV